MKFSAPSFLLSTTLAAVPALSGPASATDQSQNIPPVVQRDVVIIGGGSSGTYAAVRLIDSGKSVLVLERQSNLGGHADTWIDPDTGKPYNLGISNLHNNTLNRDFFNRIGVEMTGASLSSDRKKHYVDFSTGNSVPGYTPVPPDRFFAAVQKYGSIIGEKWPYLVESLQNLPFPVPEELLESFSVFVERYGLQDLAEGYNSIAQLGNLWEKAMAYVIMGFDNKLLEQFVIGSIMAASGDNQEIFDKAADVIGADNIIYQVSDMHISRLDNGNRILISSTNSDGSRNELIHAKKLLIAVPPTIESLDSIGLDTRAGEAELFEKLRGHMYGSAVISHPALNPLEEYHNISPDNPYNLQSLPGCPAIYPLAPGESDKFATIFAGLDPTLGEDEIRAILTEQVNNVAAGAGTGAAGEATIHVVKNHSPIRLGVDVDEIRDGFYLKMFALQGTTDTYWTGAAWATQDSSEIWDSFENTVLPRLLAEL